MATLKATKIDLCFARIGLLVLMFFSTSSVMVKVTIFATSPNLKSGLLKGAGPNSAYLIFWVPVFENFNKYLEGEKRNPGD
jgi:hypothetical protein